MSNSTLSKPHLLAIYELGRMYYESGYFVPAERIFNGLVAIDQSEIPARLALGLLKLERGDYPEAVSQFQQAIKQGWVQAKIGLASSFIAQGELSRALSLLKEAESDDLDSDHLKLLKALRLRCENEVVLGS